MQTDPTKISEEMLRKNVLYNAALADMVRDGLCLVDCETAWRRHVKDELKKTKNELEDKLREVANLNAELLDLHRQMRQPNPVLSPRIFRLH